ncbi:hypothetical protein [Methylomonas methanica]|uniref:VCBS repeat-containing protein n=1 Tax=Methylomonas methanica (strain DSM 25384 / MC09) TaxID=857087 RepID=G0A3M6_METMM|nr:hypothetical protein [Methylomonas methanica]AEG01498.1 hypothetical protein Metme_3122 [Methylomonas methanica MC09]
MFNYLIPILLLPTLCLANDENANVPTELQHFVEANTSLLAYAGADLNGDGLSDYVFILERQKTNDADPEIETGQRPLKIALRQADNSLKIVKTNDKIVFCSTCGGVFGDPFAELSATTKSFSVSHYGGSNWRWTNRFQFNYSRRDNTWQLVRVEESSFHTSDPETAKTTTYTPPKDFGKIDIADFDPENLRGEGRK